MDWVFGPQTLSTVLLLAIKLATDDHFFLAAVCCSRCKRVALSRIFTDISVLARWTGGKDLRIEETKRCSFMVALLVEACGHRSRLHAPSRLGLCACVKPTPSTSICRTAASRWSEMAMSMLIFRACLLPPGSLSFATVLVWEGADRLSARDPTKTHGRRQLCPELMARGMLLPSSS